jgi:hypothetical protein
MATRFDAVGDYLIRTADLPSSSTFTISLWMYISVDTNALVDLCLLTDAAGGYVTLGLDADGTTLRLASTNGSSTGTNLSASTWYHVAVSHSGSSLVGYLNGVADITRNDNISFSTVYLLFGFNGVNTYFNGRIAGAKLWSGAALSADEIVQEMGTLRPQRTADLYGVWPMWPGATERLADYSGYGRTLTAGGTLVDEDGPPVGWGASPLYAVPSLIPDPAASAVSVMMRQYRQRWA